MQLSPRSLISPLHLTDASGQPLKLEAKPIAGTPFADVLKISLHPAPPSGVPDNAPQNIYAQIFVNGQKVGEVYKGGSCMMTNAAAAQVGALADGAGLGLARQRTQQIADATGGEIRLMNEFAPKKNVSTAPASSSDLLALFMTRNAK